MSTSTDIATASSPNLPSPLTTLAAAPTTDAMSRLAEWVTAASQVTNLISPLVGSDFVPRAYKPDVARNAPDEEKQAAWNIARANAVSAVLFGLSLGFDPMTSLQQIYLVHGRPGLYAKAKVALLKSRGYRIWTVKREDDEVIVSGHAPGDEDHVETISITIEMAKTAGWTKNDTYMKTPQDMLWARAAGRVCDLIGGSVLLGIGTVEDIPDEEPTRVPATVGPSAPAARVTAAEILGEKTVADRMASHAVDAVAAGDRHAATMVQDAIDAGADMEALLASHGLPMPGADGPGPSPVDGAADDANPGTVVEPAEVGHLPVVVDGADGQPIIDIGDAPLAMTAEQSARLHGLARAQGRNTKAKLGPLIKQVTGRDVADTSELTVDQAEQVIARLEADAAKANDGEPR